MTQQQSKRGPQVKFVDPEKAGGPRFAVSYTREGHVYMSISEGLGAKVVYMDAGQAAALGERLFKTAKLTQKEATQ